MIIEGRAEQWKVIQENLPKLAEFILDQHRSGTPVKVVEVIVDEKFKGVKEIYKGRRK